MGLRMGGQDRRKRKDQVQLHSRGPGKQSTTGGGSGINEMGVGGCERGAQVCGVDRRWWFVVRSWLLAGSGSFCKKTVCWGVSGFESGSFCKKQVAEVGWVCGESGSFCKIDFFGVALSLRRARRRVRARWYWRSKRDS